MTNRKPRIKFILLKTIGIILFWWGLVVTLLAAIGVIVEPTDDFVSFIIGIIFIGVIPLIVGYLIRRNVRKNISKQTSMAMNHGVLRLAKNRGGILTETEVSLNLRIPLRESKRLLEALVISGYCTVDVNNNGIIEYRFNEYITD